MGSQHRDKVATGMPDIFFSTVSCCSFVFPPDAARLAWYHSLTSAESAKVEYATEWHSESPPHKSMPPSSKKWYRNEQEAMMDAMSSNSDSFNPEGKAVQDITDWCQESECAANKAFVDSRRSATGCNLITLLRHSSQS